MTLTAVTFGSNTLLMKSNSNLFADNDYQDPDEFCSKAPRSGLVNRGGAAGGSTTENPYDNGPVGAKSNHDDSDCGTYGLNT